MIFYKHCQFSVFSPSPYNANVLSPNIATRIQQKSSPSFSLHIHTYTSLSLSHTHTLTHIHIHIHYIIFPATPTRRSRCHDLSWQGKCLAACGDQPPIHGRHTQGVHHCQHRLHHNQCNSKEVSQTGTSNDCLCLMESIREYNIMSQHVCSVSICDYLNF